MPAASVSSRSPNRWATATPLCAPVTSSARTRSDLFSPGDEIRYARVASDHAGRLRFVAQPEPLGYSHAVVCARDFVGQDPFLHLVGDRLYISRTEKGCAQ